MRCPSCQAENPDAIKFCGACGTPLTNRCAKCGFANPPGFKFCGECGAALSESQVASEALAEGAAHVRTGYSASKPRQTPSGERRHLTVLFCDLVNSTGIAAQLDPEEWRELVADYHRLAAEAIERFEGYVAQYLGDGVMAYFGWPEAHENDAERAVRAGLAILEAILNLNQQATRPELSARVGIDSGAVVIGSSAGKEADVFGDVPNIAARVQAAAAPNTVIVTAATHRLIAGVFVVEEQGPQALRGVAQQVELFRIIQPSGVRGRLGAAAASRGLTPFVGREDELRVLMSRWQSVQEGEGQVVTIIGEAGIGKSRLVQRFREQIGENPHSWLECAAAPFFQNTPFYAIAEMLRQNLHWEQRLAAFEASLGLPGANLNETAPLTAPLFDPPVAANHPPSTLGPDEQRKRLLASLVAWTFGAAKSQPLVIATEDLHWADPSTLELIQLLVEQGATARLLLLYTARPEFRPPWPLRAHHTQIALNRLSARNVRTMVEKVVANSALSDATVTAVVERTGGVPLFAEELTRAVLESGDTKLTGREIPATLHDSLMARLDRLGPAKEVAQVAAVLGREFSYELLHEVHPNAETELRRALGILADAELVYVRGIAPHATYNFKHALIRDAAYEALLKSRRKELHRLVAQTIDQKFPALKETQPEVLARHWTEAGEVEPAIAEWSRAGKAAEERNAFKEALESYQQALTLLNQVPESRERDLRELELRQSVVRMLWVTRGFSAPETIDATDRAVLLAEKTGSLAQLANWVMSKGVTSMVSGDLAVAGMLADQALELALRDRNPTNLGAVHCLLLQTCYFRGDLAGAEKHFSNGLSFFADPGFRQYAGGAAGVLFAFGVGSWNAWTLGRSDLAQDRIARMKAVINAANPYDEIASNVIAACLCVYSRENRQAEALLGRALTLLERHEFPLAAGISRCALGRAIAQLGRPAKGVKLILEGIGVLNEIGTRMNITILMAWLAEAQDRDDGTLDALETIEQALAANPDELVYRPEALRVRGELRLKLGRPELAGADFRDAIALAQKIGARAWELRATISLARLLDAQGQREQARAMLAKIHRSFTEGFDTADLIDAKALLEELGQ
ncbi:MAG TPA: adenylate/guanylate cyclase domain-containing protein [Candidatus Binataceae bacterium]|nr:adenylate/guanylate cyclase domain-containing protein [Candidatus Binataceae bacterium]